MTDRSILRSLGLMLQRDAHKVATPRPIETVCAWCQKERGEKAQPHQSHGICAQHKHAMMAEAQLRAKIAA